MIKIRLTDPSNMKCFSGLLQTRDLLRDYSIDITDSSDYDYEFVDASEFMNLSFSPIILNKCNASTADK